MGGIDAGLHGGAGAARLFAFATRGQFTGIRS